MGMPAEVIDEIFTVIQGGSAIGDPAEIIQFPLDNGNTIDVVEKTYKGTNGVGFNYWVVAFETLVGGVATAVSGGAALLTTSVPAFAAALAPAMGLTVGYISYNIAPELWDKIANELMEAGETIGGKVVAYMDENGVLTYSRQAIDILMGNLIEAGVFETIGEIPDFPGEGEVELTDYTSALDMWKYGVSLWGVYVTYEGNAYSKLLSGLALYKDYVPYALELDFSHSSFIPTGWFSFMRLVEPQETITFGQTYGNNSVGLGVQLYYNPTTNTATIVNVEFSPGGATSGIPGYWFQGIFENGNRRCISGINVTADVDKVQPGAKLPKTGDVETEYPAWPKTDFPEIDPKPGQTDPQEIPDRYPVEYPDLLPDDENIQVPAQQPDPAVETNPGVVEKIITAPEHQPITGYPEPVPTPEPVDPDPGDEEEEIEEPDTPVPPDPITPDPGEPVTPVIPIVPLPDTVGSNKLFTVYNPDSSQLDSLGAYLWDADLIDQLKRIWQEPLDGIIGLRQVYCTPITGSPREIILGFLHSGISAKVVTNQFVTIDCGSVTVPELKENATDYTPYTSMELYLPFIGITEIDTNEFMAGSIGVKYHIDVYTGSCLAEVSMIRTKDVPNGGVVYTFTGNCSQQIPLTSGDTRELIATLMTAAGVGIGIASGGALGIAEATAGISHVIRREMMHVSHSGNLSSNAGIMGQKKPYLIINRQNPYNANNYNKLYGYPCNKTVYLGNCEGYVRVKAGHLRTMATQAEKDEIMEFLTDGVIM